MGHPKQLLRVGGRTLVRWAVELLQTGGCSPVVVVLSSTIPVPDDVREESSIVFTMGGATRQDSVANGLRLITSDRVVIHDAARPLADVALLRRVLARLDDVEGVIPAIPVDETIKRVADERSLETIDRNGLWRAQTPSAFRTEALRAAYEHATADGFTGTDEGQLIERYEGRVAIVLGSRMNVKVTYPEDVHLVESIMGDKR